MSNVVRLIDHAPVSVSDETDLFDWALAWLAAFEQGQYGKLRTLVILVQNEAGQLATVSQSVDKLDVVSIVGLLSTMAARKAMGEGAIADLRQ